ncbi:hypothetical protein Pen01_40070 [Phytomonospora endophytica]|nr:hypothetical protein Pen01_40070 [Phytomonospora endophytica]
MRVMFVAMADAIRSGKLRETGLENAPSLPEPARERLGRAALGRGREPYSLRQ